MVSEDGIADDVRHSAQATDASPNAEQKPRQHGRVHERLFSITNRK
jgi:hypothetical protein